MKKAIAIATASAAVLAWVILTGPAVGAGGTHILTVDNTPYAHTKAAGGTIHWETPTPQPHTASYEARNQTWTGHGAEHLPCAGGVHWVSNENVLTVSHCLEGGGTSTTSTSTTVRGTTTTSSTSLPGSTSTTSTTGVQPTSSTSSTVQQTSTTKPEPTTTFGIATTTPSTTAWGTISTQPPVCGETVEGENYTRCTLPETGSTAGTVAIWAFIALILGLVAASVARRQR